MKVIRKILDDVKELEDLISIAVKLYPPTDAMIHTNKMPRITVKNWGFDGYFNIRCSCCNQSFQYYKPSRKSVVVTKSFNCQNCLQLKLDTACNHKAVGHGIFDKLLWKLRIYFTNKIVKRNISNRTIPIGYLQSR